MSKRIAAVFLILILSLSAVGGIFSYAEGFSGDDKIVVVLDPGHGAYTMSNRGEGAYNLRMAHYIKDALDANGSFSVYLTHDYDDGDISHYERAKIADSVNADIMISVHFNGSENTESRGIEAWASVIDKYDMSELAGMLIDYALEKVPEVPFGGVFRRPDTENFYWNEEYQWDVKDDDSAGVLSDYYGIITWGLKFGIPTFIIEEMYLSNGEDLVIADNEENLKNIGAAQAQAIIDYYTGHAHTYGSEYVTDIPASCISLGKQSLHCTACGHRKNVGAITKTLDENPHFMRILERVDATCDHDGYTIWSCVYTDSLINKAKIEHEAHGETTVIPKLEHNYTIIDSSQAYPGHRGYATYRCENCGDSYTVTFDYGKSYCDEHGHVDIHDDEKEDVAPTCTEAGLKYMFCLACGEEHEVKTEPTGHTWSVQSIVSATCETDGETVSRCSVCGETNRTALAATGHSFEYKVIEEPGCTHEGKAREVCRICSKEGAEKSVPAIGHIYNEGVVKKKATAFKSGETEYTCTVCGDIYIKEIPRTSPIALGVIISVAVALILLAALVIILFRIRKRAIPPVPPEEIAEAKIEADTVYDAKPDEILQAEKEMSRVISKPEEPVKDDEFDREVVQMLKKNIGGSDSE